LCKKLPMRVLGIQVLLKSVCCVILGMIPLWLFTLGQVLVNDDMHITIPFTNIMIMLACYLIPVITGLLIQRYCKRVSEFIVRILRPVFIVFIVFMFTFGVWTNLYIFRLIRPLLLLAGCLLPYVGFLLSGVVAFILRQPPPRILTIAIETGIQNTGLPIILLKFSLPQPEADLSIVAPIVIAMFMPLPLWIAFAVTTIWRRFKFYLYLITVVIYYAGHAYRDKNPKYLPLLFGTSCQMISRPI